MNKVIQIVLITGSFISLNIGHSYSQQEKVVPKLMPLIHPDLHAGCYISNDTGTFAELSADSVYFNLRGFDEVFTELRKVKIYPGYTRGFTKEGYTIYIREYEGKKEGCLTAMSYKVLIIYKNKLYRYRLKGFCGC